MYFIVIEYIAKMCFVLFIYNNYRVFLLNIILWNKIAQNGMKQFQIKYMSHLHEINKIKNNIIYQRIKVN